MDDAEFWDGITKEELIQTLREIDRELVEWEGVDLRYHCHAAASPRSVAIAERVAAMNQKEYGA